MRSLCLAAAILLAASVGFSEEKAAPGKKPVEMFDGKTLNGWKVITCDVEVKDGCIFIKGGNGVVRLEKMYKDYVLECDWKALSADKWDSGIYFRCTDPPKGRPWPKEYQCNLRKGMEGNVSELKAESKGLCKDGEWNHFKLTVQGTGCSLEINGKPAWKVDGIKNPEGYIALQAEVPGGGQFLFKNITLLELDSK